MAKSFSESYKDAGVDITAGYKSVELMKKHIGRTLAFGKTDTIGGFGGLFELDLEGIKEPVLVSGTDGVGTKLKMAFLTDKHDTVGIDCVAMCVNDIICVGAKPLYFLDYIAVGKNYPEKIAQIVSGVAEGCVQSECALIGGETAEMPGFYAEDEYDMAGFAVGVVDKSKILNKTDVSAGDVIIGLASSGIHSNGYSLVRKIFNLENIELNKKMPELDNQSLEEVLIEPTRIYVKPILSLLKKIKVKSIANITGGGFYENIPRALPDNLTAKISKESVPVLPIFKLMQSVGNIEERDMYNTFNMGIGMVVIVSKEDEKDAKKVLEELGEKAYTLGEVIEGNDGVILC
ncbi:MAG: phosphoribosylformylglycinamidine cyclo-ligase [Christensenellales bacterium]